MASKIESRRPPTVMPYKDCVVFVASLRKPNGFWVALVDISTDRYHRFVKDLVGREQATGEAAERCGLQTGMDWIDANLNNALIR